MDITMFLDQQGTDLPSFLSDQGIGLISTVIGFGIPFVILMKVALFFQELRTKFDDHDLLVKNNASVAIRQGSFFLALCIAIRSASPADLYGDTFISTAEIYLDFVLEGAGIIVLLFLARFWNDFVLLRGFSNNEELEKDNRGVALVEAGATIATGSIIYGANTGEGGNFITTLVFVLFGQLALTLFGKTYELITPLNMKEEIAKSNASAGLAFGGMLVALGFVLQTAVSGDSTNWSVDTFLFLASTIKGIAALLLVRWTVDKLVMHRIRLQDAVGNQNWSVLLLAECAIIGWALWIADFI